jgi:uncharacterized repeat protein (TIGR02543 family)
MTTTVLSVGIVGTASASATTLTAVGSFASAGGTGLTTASATLATAGDVLVIWVQAQAETTAGHVTGITKSSGAGAIGTPVNVIQYITGSGHSGNEDEIWYAPVTTAGAITLTFAWSGSTSGEQEYSTEEFQPSAASVYSADTTGSLPSIASSTTVTFPTLTPTCADELYAGYNSNNTSGSYGSPTSGYTVESGGTAGVTGDAVIFDPSASTTQSPTAVATSGASTQSAIGVFLLATSGATDTVTFNSEGGSAVGSQSCPNASTMNLPAAPTYAGYTFNGWFTAATGGSLVSSPYTLSASTTPLYAQWTANANYTVTFNGNGSTGGSMANEVENSPTALTANGYTYAGHTFTGWNTVANGTGGTAYAGGATYAFTANATLYAQWSTNASYTVTFSGNGSTGGSMANEVDNSPTALTANNYTYTGHYFTGWNTVANGTGGTAYAGGATYAFTANATLYAQWAAGYTVTFNANGGTGTMANENANTATALTANSYTYAGYTFTGWNTVANGTGGTAYANDASYPFASSTTLYAQWTVNSGGGGGGGGGTTTATLVVTVPSLSVTSGGTVTPSATVSGLATGDTATASGLTYTYAGTGTTTYAASTTAPTAVGTYSITPSGGTVTVSPSADQAKYAGTYTYVPGTLTITAVTSPPPPPVVFHAVRVVGSVWSGRTVVVTIDGTGFYGQPRITSSTGRTTIARVTHDTGKVLTVRVTVKKGTALGSHTFTIILANGKKSVVRFVLR